MDVVPITLDGPMLEGVLGWMTAEQAEAVRHEILADIVELRPSWNDGPSGGSPRWAIDVDVEADCQHSPDHGSMHTVHHWTQQAGSVEQAMAVLSEAIEVLDDLASRPLAGWVAKGGE